MSTEFEVKKTIQGKDTYIGHWNPDSTFLMASLNTLERENWAPWLAASPTSLEGRARVFPAGQIIAINSEGIVNASLSMNQIQWNGLVESLPSWDEVAGDPTTYEKTHNPHGNTLVLMSMNGREGVGISRYMIEYAKEVAEKLGVPHIIGSFRPNKFGTYKREWNMPDLDFTTYCHLQQREAKYPLDNWLRSLVKNGMRYMTTDPQAMTVPLSWNEFSKYREEYNPQFWFEFEGKVECGEVGQFIFDHPKYPNQPVYVESNMWGIIQ